MVPTVTAPVVNAYQPGKAPLLLDSSPSGLNAFLRAAKLYFRTKNIKEAEDKIAYLGAGLSGFAELYNWYAVSAEEHEAKTYDGFVADPQRRALPRDFVWEAKGRIRASRQGEEDFEDWLDEMRTLQLSLSEKVLPTRDFVEGLLYNMDPELSSVLRRGVALKNTGFHEDDLSTLSFAAVIPLAFTAPLDYENRTTTTRTPTPTADPQRPPSTGSRPTRLTELERDWLSATKGCFKCRKSWVDHESTDCTEWAPNNWIIRMPAGWKKGDPIPASPPTSGIGGVRAVHGVEDDEEVELPESLAYGSDTTDKAEGYAFPPLFLTVGSGSRRHSALALADSGSLFTLISDKLVKELGLEKAVLSRPKRYRVAIRGGEEEIHHVSHYVRVPLSLQNGSWSAGATILLVAPLEDPFDIILGVPFLRQHRITLAYHPEPQVLIEQDGLEALDLLAPVFGPSTAFENLALEEGLEKASLVSQMASVCAAQLVEGAQTADKERKEMAERAAKLMEEFTDLFPSSLPPLSPETLAASTTRHRIRLVNEKKVHNQRGFATPRKWRERWKKMLEECYEHIAAGRLRPSSSPYASAAFVVPKKDPDADPRWVNDYRGINSNSVKDRTPLPLPDVVLADAARAKFW
ncbi:hypothetical protein JCM11641_004411, partial [Rhodosporidiobolus odoratus]